MKHKLISRCTVVTSLLGCTGTVLAQPYFEFVEFVDALDPATGTYSPAHAGNPGQGMTSGVSAADYDNDGDIDLFVPNREGVGFPDYVFRNNRYNTHSINYLLEPFTEVAGDIGLDGIIEDSKPRSRAAIWLDYNADGLLDLVVVGDDAGGSYLSLDQTSPRLFQQESDGTFTNVSVVTGLDAESMIEDLVVPGDNVLRRTVGGITTGDLNGDGYPEIFVGLWNNLGNNAATEIGYRLFVNIPRPGSLTGERDYVNATSADYFPLNDIDDRYGAHWQPVIHDFNGDGWLDIFCAVDVDDNHLWINDGNPVLPDPSTGITIPITAFEDIGVAAGLELSPSNIGGFGGTDMGVAIADVNKDDLQDVFTAQWDVSSLSNHHNALFVSTGPDLPTDQYIESSAATNTQDPDGLAWGCTFGDFNNDSWIDLAVTNAKIGSSTSVDASAFFLNDKTVSTSFSSIGSTVGFDDNHNASALISADFDRDGDLDLVQVVLDEVDSSDVHTGYSLVRYLKNNALCESGCPVNNWLFIRPRLETENTFATGTVIYTTAGTGSRLTEQSRVITTGISMAGQEPAEAHFGFGSNLSPSEPISVVVQWPNNRLPATLSGTVSTLANQVHDVNPCSVYDLVAPFGVLNTDDSLKFVDFFIAGDMRADINQSGALDYFDWYDANLAITAGCP